MLTRVEDWPKLSYSLVILPDDKWFICNAYCTYLFLMYWSQYYLSIMWLKEMIALSFNKFSACCTRGKIFKVKILYASSIKFIWTFYIWRDEKDASSWEIVGKKKALTQYSKIMTLKEIFQREDRH